jgi:L-seryl-tRNA(Ser) seleniumtransferase
VEDINGLERAMNERTAMIYILAGPGDDGPLGTAAVSAVAKRHDVPVLVDAAAEILTFPNVHLQRGATAVCYSGGKCIRGPQAAGLLLGEKSLLQAAWLNSAPHHAFGRSLKVGKEEIMGMLAAVEAWKKRDHEAEWKAWVSWLDHIGSRVSAVKGVTTEVVQPRGLSNRTPSLRISWDGSQIGITGTEAAKHLLDTEPRIVVAGGTGNRPDRMASTLTITPYMMVPGDHKVVADRVFATLSKPPAIQAETLPSGDPAPVAGQWVLHIEFSRGSADHVLLLEQNRSSLLGTHRGEFVSGDLAGTVAGDQVRFRSSQRIEGTRLGWDFRGQVSGDTMTGTVNMGEYGDARWTARRHTYRTPGGVVRPVKSV